MDKRTEKIESLLAKAAGLLDEAECETNNWDTFEPMLHICHIAVREALRQVSGDPL